MAKRTRPRAGSLAYSPRRRASKITPSLKRREISDVKPLGFLGYKVGMAHMTAFDHTQNAITKGMKVSVPCTIVITPPIQVFGIRQYVVGYMGLKTYTDIIVEKPNAELKRKITIKDKNPDEDPENSVSKKLEEIEKNKDKICEVRLLCHTRPGNIKLKKTPDLLEIPIGGTVEEQIKFAKENLGKEIHVKNIFSEMEYVDIRAVTKGKGLQGPIRRWGIKKQHRKVTKKRRHTGVLNPETPRHTSWRAPISGQTGFHTRTELNKQILRISDENVNPKGGFVNYGLVTGDYIIVKGSIPGPAKRVVGIMPSVRKPKAEKKFEIVKLIN